MQRPSWSIGRTTLGDTYLKRVYAYRLAPIKLHYRTLDQEDDYELDDFFRVEVNVTPDEAFTKYVSPTDTQRFKYQQEAKAKALRIAAEIDQFRQLAPMRKKLQWWSGEFDFVFEPYRQQLQKLYGKNWQEGREKVIAAEKKRKLAEEKKRRAEERKAQQAVEAERRAAESLAENLARNARIAEDWRQRVIRRRQDAEHQAKMREHYAEQNRLAEYARIQTRVFEIMQQGRAMSFSEIGYNLGYHDTVLICDICKEMMQNHFISKRLYLKQCIREIAHDRRHHPFAEMAEHLGETPELIRDLCMEIQAEGHGRCIDEVA